VARIVFRDPRAARCGSVGIVAGVLACLAALGAVSAIAGGANPSNGSILVLIWGALAMSATAAIGHLAGRAL
jgi:VIT1/CCC1 family predicted Fe2+/Mn2+ transporter